MTDEQTNNLVDKVSIVVFIQSPTLLKVYFNMVKYLTSLKMSQKKGILIQSKSTFLDVKYMTKTVMKKKYFLLILLSAILNLIPNSSYTQKPEESYVYTPDKLNLYLYEFGKGDTILVLHGGFGAEHSYLMDALTPLKKKFHFLLYDQRGSLRSPAPDSLLTFEKMLLDIETIRKEFKLDKVSLLAHSMGTRIAMEYAHRYPEKIKKIVLLSSFQPVSSDNELRDYATYYLENRESVQKEVTKIGLPSDKKLWTYKMNGYKWRISFASVNIFRIDKWRDMKGGVAFFNQKSANLIYPTAPKNWDYTNSFRQCEFPITVINGDYDYLNFTAKSFEDLLTYYAENNDTTLSNILKDKGKSLTEFVNNYNWIEFEQELPTLEVYIVKDAGHRVWIDNPKEFRKLLIKSLSR